jgi:hypothetical protein
LSDGIVKTPLSFEVVDRTVPVFASVAVTLAPGIAAPESSTTVPAIVPVAPWAYTDPTLAKHSNSATTARADSRTMPIMSGSFSSPPNNKLGECRGGA